MKVYTDGTSKVVILESTADVIAVALEEEKKNQHKKK